MITKKPIFFAYDLQRKRGVDMIAVIHVDDRNTEVLEVAVTQDGEPVNMSGKTVTARFVDSKTKVLFSDHVTCSVNEQGHLMIPIDNAVIQSRKCDLKIEISIADGSDILTLQFPLWVRVNGSILDQAETTPESQGTIPEQLEDIREELLRLRDSVNEDAVFDILDSTLSGGSGIVPALSIDNDNQSGDYILYYIDSDEVRHDLFDFSQHFFSEQAARSAINTAYAAAGRAENAYTAATNAASAANTAAAGAAHVDISAEQTATGATITVTDRDGVETEVHIDTLTAITTWNDVRNAVRLGLGAQLFPPGYEFEVACPNCNYTIPFVVRGHDTILAKNNKLTHAMILEHKYVYGHNGAAYSAVQFDAPEALFYAEEGLTAGTYHFNWNDSNGLSVGDYQFTLASGIPPHGQITINTSARTVTTYASVGATTAIESNVQLSQGTGGTDLGTTGSGNLNHVHRILGGNNNYAQSAARQLINSAEAAGDVWAPVSKFDRPPSWATSLEGFARVLDPEFLAVVETAAIPCRTSNVFEAASLDGTQFATASTYTLYDKFFLLSRPEIFGDWDSASIKDGVQLEYYVGLSNAERIRRDKNGSARDCFLRSPYPGHASIVRDLNSGGVLGSGIASNSYGVAPACIIA
ncbi:MAG: hypothetical protein II127_03475 [Ruminococcus sp.]|nr:hypothetical protein [Ruminococcus sp.]